MPNITIDLSDLHKIIAAVHELELESRTRSRIMNKFAASDPPSRSKYAELFREMTPLAEEDLIHHYQPLMDALVAEDVPAVQRMLPRFAYRVSPQS